MTLEYFKSSLPIELRLTKRKGFLEIRISDGGGDVRGGAVLDEEQKIEEFLNQPLVKILDKKI